MRGLRVLQIGILAMGLFAWAGSAEASKVDRLIDKLVEKGILNRNEATALQAEIEAEERTESKTSQTAAPAWTENLTAKGDVRLRFETFDYKHTNKKDRTRARLRLRWGLEKKFSDEWKAGFRVSSGSTDGATTTNQTLDDQFTLNEFDLNRAYAIYTPTDRLRELFPAIHHVEIGGGKVANPFLPWGAGVVWDSDVEPEGIYEKVDFRLADIGQSGYWDVTGLLGQWIVEEESTAEDVRMLAYGVGTRVQNDHKQWLDFKYAFYDWQDYDSVLRAGLASSEEPFSVSGLGSTPAGNDLQVDSFKIHSMLLQGGMPVETFFFGEQPLKLFWLYAFNTEEGDAVANPNDDETWTAGLTLGKAKKKDSAQVTAQYYWIEANSLVGDFSDADIGDGGTNWQSVRLQWKYMLADYLQFVWTNYINDRIQDATPASDETSWRSQVDLIFKF